MLQYDHIFCLFSKAKARISETMFNHDLLKFQIANPCTPVRFRYSPPNGFSDLGENFRVDICLSAQFRLGFLKVSRGMSLRARSIPTLVHVGRGPGRLELTSRMTLISSIRGSNLHEISLSPFRSSRRSSLRPLT